MQLTNTERKKLLKANQFILAVLSRLDNTQAKRYEKLRQNPKAHFIASQGILRHFASWKRDSQGSFDKLLSLVDISAVREIIDDAQAGHSIFLQTNDDEASDLNSTKARTHRYN